MIRIEMCDKWKPGTSCYDNNAHLMGQQIGRAPGAISDSNGNRIMVMVNSFIREECQFLMIVNEATGERVKVFFDDPAVRPASSEERPTDQSRSEESSFLGCREPKVAISSSFPWLPAGQPVSCVICGEFMDKDLMLNDFPNAEVACNEIVSRENEGRALKHASTHGGCDTLLLRGTMARDESGHIVINLKEGE